MRAVTYHRYGPPDVLVVSDVPEPTPGAGELLVEVGAAEATKADCELRAMDFPVGWFKPMIRLFWGWRRPRKAILGGYFAGRVVGLGEGASRFAVGDAIFGSAGMGMGAYAERMVVPESATLAAVPAGVSLAEAAALPLGGLNALHFMRLAGLSVGERVLINGAGGSIGMLALQIARELGARVTAVDAPHKLPALRELGAEAVVDYTSAPLERHEGRYEVVFDMVAGSRFATMRRLLTPSGRYLTGNPTLLRMLQCKTLSWRGGQRGHFAFAGESQEEIEALAALAARGAVRPRLDRVAGFEDAASAHAAVEDETRVGMVVLAARPGACTLPHEADHEHEHDNEHKHEHEHERDIANAGQPRRSS